MIDGRGRLTPVHEPTSADRCGEPAQPQRITADGYLAESIGLPTE